MRHSFIQWELETERPCASPVSGCHCRPTQCLCIVNTTDCNIQTTLWNLLNTMKIWHVLTWQHPVLSVVRFRNIASYLPCRVFANMQENVSGSGRRMKNNRATHVGADTCAQDLIVFTRNNDRWAQIKGKRSKCLRKAHNWMGWKPKAVIQSHIFPPFITRLYIQFLILTCLLLLNL